MKMNDPAICCSKCFDVIARRNQKAAQFWLQLCDLEKTHGLFGIKCNDTPAMRDLELMKFIITTETNSTILIKVLNKQTDEQGPFFCRGDCE